MEEVQTPQPENLTPEQKMHHVKLNLFGTLATLHNNLFNFIQGLPINEDQKKFAIANLIQCLHWVEDGIKALQFEVVEPPPSQGDANVEEGKQQEGDQPEHQN